MRHGLDHAAGSQAIASALEPHGGRLFWRAFVYDDGRGLDIVAQPYAQFKPLDGKFPANVSVQIKYGPRDFQPREPIHPLLGALEHTATALELQITQEYLGHDTHAVFLPSLWEEILQSPTPNGTTLAGFLADSPDAAMVGVSNVSDAPNWTGHLLAQANLYGFGRLAWDPQLTAATIAREWISLTFGQDPLVNKNLSEILLRSHEIFVGYTAPFALGQVHGNGPSWDLCHYDPDPARKNGTDLFRADADGIGIDRTLTSGSGVLEQYCPTLQKLFNDPKTCPPGLLLWFHRLPWDHLLPDGRTLAEAIHASYFDSANEVEHFISLWNELEGKIDDASFRHVAEKFRLQRQHAWHWATTMTAYFEKLRAPEPQLAMAV
jgi:alpha-glucuronidase